MKSHTKLFFSPLSLSHYKMTDFQSFHTFEKVSRRRQAAAEIPAAYLIEDEEDLDAEYAPQWPQQQVARPSVAFLVKHYAPPMTKPKPLEERWTQQAAENKAASKKAAEGVAAAEVVYKAKMAELAKAEADSKTINKWSAARTSSAALIKRLQQELAEATEKKKAAVAAHEKIFKAGETARWMIDNQKKRDELWTGYKKLIHEDWEANYGKHYPRKNSNDLFGYYDVVAKEEFDDGWTRFTFKAGTNVEHLCRELDMGGHDRQEFGGGPDAPWVEIRTDVLKAFENPA